MVGNEVSVIKRPCRSKQTCIQKFLLPLRSMLKRNLNPKSAVAAAASLPSSFTSMKDLWMAEEMVIRVELLLFLGSRNCDRSLFDPSNSVLRPTKMKI